MKKIKIVFNAPVTLSFCLLSVVVLFLDNLTNGNTTNSFFCIYNSPLNNITTYVRMFGHVLGHTDWSHLVSNLMYILILGPLIEEKYSSKKMLILILVTAFVTALVKMVFFPNVALLGASGIVFALILLASFTSTKNREIPITAIIVAIIYLGDQIVTGLFTGDNVSQLSHIIGGIIGCIFGYTSRGRG